MAKGKTHIKGATVNQFGFKATFIVSSTGGFTCCVLWQNRLDSEKMLCHKCIKCLLLTCHLKINTKPFSCCCNCLNVERPEVSIILQQQVTSLSLRGASHCSRKHPQLSLFLWWQDFMIMLVHHLATILLITFSYGNNMIRAGTLVMCTHDASDIFLEVQQITQRWFVFSAPVPKPDWLVASSR